MMINLYNSFSNPLTDDTLFAWHGMLTGGRRDLKDIGRYRTGDEPMQVISGPVDAENSFRGATFFTRAERDDALHRVVQSHGSGRGGPLPR